MNRLPDERDMEQVVRSWMREDDEHATDRNRQVGRIMGRVDETHQRRGAWRLFPFWRGARRVDDDDEELFVAGSGTVATRRGVSSAMAVAAVAVLVILGVTLVALWPSPVTGPAALSSSTPAATARPTPSPTPGATVPPEDAELRDRFAGTWSSERTSLEDVLEVYAEDAVHTALWHDGVERFRGAHEIWERIQVSRAVNAAEWIPLLDAGTGEHRYLGVTSDMGGIACVIWVEEARITRHDCILPTRRSVSEMPAFDPPAADTLEVKATLEEDLVTGWATADRESIERSVSSEIVHQVAYDNSLNTLAGIDAYMSVMGYDVIIEGLTPSVPLPAPEGEHRWTDFNSVAGGSLCTFWEREGLIVRHDCIVPTFNYLPPEERGLPPDEPAT